MSKDWANYTASPLRAFENELGVQDPVGFWDPAGSLGVNIDAQESNMIKKSESKVAG